MKQYKKYSKGRSVGWSDYHIEWCTKYRYKIFALEKYKNLCKIILREACKRYNIKYIDCEVDIDHIHILVSIPFSMTPSETLNFLKGFSSKCLFILMPTLRNYYPKRHLWSPGKFVGSIGHITLDKAKEYLDKHS